MSSFLYITVQNTKLNTAKHIGKNMIMILSKWWGCWLSLLFLTSTTFLMRNFPCRIHAYSKRAAALNIMHQSIHLTRATGLCLVLGIYLDTEFRVLNMHRNRVTSRPRRPGICSAGIKKLICKSTNIF